MPGYDRESKETVRRFAVEGYDAIAVNLHWRDAPGADSDDAAAASRANGGVPDDRFVGDAAGPCAGYGTGRRRTGGSRRSASAPAAGRRSSRRSSWMCRPRSTATARSSPPSRRRASRSGYGRSPTGSASCGRRYWTVRQRRPQPSPDQVDELEKLLRGHGKTYEFHRYGGAGHAFFSVDRPTYRVAAALDGWQRIHTFLATHLREG